MRAPRLTTIACLLAVALAALPATARAESPVIADCSAHNRLTHHYSVAQLRSAAAHLPAEVSEYTACQALIQRQLLIELGHQKVRPVSAASSGSGGSSTWVPIVIVVGVIVLAGGGFALLARRRAIRR